MQLFYRTKLGFTGAEEQVNLLKSINEISRRKITVHLKANHLIIFDVTHFREGVWTRLFALDSFETLCQALKCLDPRQRRC